MNIEGINRLSNFLYLLNIHSNPALNTTRNREILRGRIEELANMDLSEEEQKTYSVILQVFDSLGGIDQENFGGLSEGKREVEPITRNKIPEAAKVVDVFGKNKGIIASNFLVSHRFRANIELDGKLIDRMNYEDPLFGKNIERIAAKKEFNFSDVESIYPIKPISTEEEIMVGEMRYSVHHLVAAYLNMVKAPIDPFTERKLIEKEKREICKLYGIDVKDFDDLWKKGGYVDQQFEAWVEVRGEGSRENLEGCRDIKTIIRIGRFLELVEEKKGISSREYVRLVEILEKRVTAEYWEEQ